MEASNTKDFVKTVEKTKGFINAWIGLILTVLAVITIFVVAALEGTKEIKAPNALSGVLLTQWRHENSVTSGFPEPFVTVIEHNNREYYFVVEELNPDTQEIISWYWAYDGGLGYVFSDYKYYVLVSITFIFSLFVAVVNYNSTIDKGIKTETFNKTLLFYQKRKEKVAGYTQYLSLFCSFKTKEAYIEEKRNIVEGANLDWDDYVNKKINLEDLEKWQRKNLKKIEKIKILKLSPTDLLFETRYSGSKIRLLPQSQDEHKKVFMYKSVATKFITSFASGLVAGFGIILGNWVLGLILGFAIIISAITSIISAADYVTHTLKNRYIGKSEFLGEFDNVKEEYKKQYEENKKVKEIKEKTEKEKNVPNPYQTQEMLLGTL